MDAKTLINAKNSTTKDGFGLSSRKIGAGSEPGWTASCFCLEHLTLKIQIKRNLLTEFKMFNLIVTGILFLILSTTLSASNCFLSENIECSCSKISLNCSGIQKEFTEAKQLLLNVSATHSTIDVLYLDWNIRNLIFESNFTFEGLKLQKLTLGRDLKSLHDGLFLGLDSTLISLNLQYNNFELIDNQPLSSLYNLKELFLDFNYFSDINPDMFFNLSKLELLSLSGNHLSMLERDLLMNLPAIHTLILDNNNLSFISDIKISSLSLKELFVKNCSMNGSLESDSLKGIPNVEHIDFSSNQLVGIDSYAFSDLNNLKVLNLSYNMLVYLKDNALSALHNLRSLDLRNNKLLLIAEKSFMNLTNLKHLDLSGNKLEVFLQKYTVDLYAVESINLENNKIKRITTGTFSASRNLQEILLEGNILECSCELSYFAGYLLNNSHIRVGDSAVTCDSPSSMKGTEVIKMDFVAMKCEDLDLDMPVSEDEDYDYTDILNSTKLDELTTEKNISDESTSTMHTNSSSASEISTFTDDVPSVTESTSTSAYGISNSSHIDTSTGTTSFNANSSFLGSTVEEITTSTFNMSTTLSNDDFNYTIDLGIATTEDTKVTTQSEASKTIIHILDSFNLGKDFCFKWKISDTNVKKCVIQTQGTNGNKQKAVKCPTSGEGIEQCINPEKIYSLCINVYFDGKPKIQSCPKIPILTTFTESSSESVKVTSMTPSTSPSTTPPSTSPSTTPPSISPSTTPPSTSPSTTPPSTSPSTTPSTSPSTTPSTSPSTTPSTSPTTPQSTSPSTTPSTIPPSTSPTSMTPPSTIPTKLSNSSTSVGTTKVPIELTTIFKVPDTTKSKGVIPFKVISFDVTFNHLNSEALIEWTVNKIESRLICYLKLSLSSYNLNRSKGEFNCSNSSYRIQDIEYEAYKICLISYHDHYKSQMMCKSSLGHSYELKASKSKDHGYTNSSLIAVICLLIIVLIIIIIVTMKKMVKKRSESVIYNVSAEEQKVQKRTSQFRPESCVRYSYTVKEHEEL